MKCMWCNKDTILIKGPKLMALSSGPSPIRHEYFYCSRCDESFCTADQMDDLREAIKKYEDLND